MVYSYLCSEDIQVFTLTLKYVNVIVWAIPAKSQTGDWGYGISRGIEEIADR